MNSILPYLAVIVYIAFAIGILLVSGRLRSEKKTNMIQLLSPVLIGFFIGVMMLFIAISLL